MPARKVRAGKRCVAGAWHNERKYPVSETGIKVVISTCTRWDAESTAPERKITRNGQHNAVEMHYDPQSYLLPEEKLSVSAVFLAISW